MTEDEDPIIHIYDNRYLSNLYICGRMAIPESVYPDVDSAYKALKQGYSDSICKDCVRTVYEVFKKGLEDE